VTDLTVHIDQDLNDSMNVDPSGKSINVLRFFTGKGFLVWGARTLAGKRCRVGATSRFDDSSTWLRTSIKNATEAVRIRNRTMRETWIKIKAMIENFLIVQWRDGALVGTKPDDAFYVRVGPRFNHDGAGRARGQHDHRNRHGRRAPR